MVVMQLVQLVTLPEQLLQGEVQLMQAPLT